MANAAEWHPLRLDGRLLEDRIAIITGGASERGIGKATAKLFAAHGALVVLLDLDPKQITAALKEIPGDHIGIECDVTSKEQGQKAIDTALKKFERIDILFECVAHHIPHHVVYLWVILLNVAAMRPK